MESPSEVVGHMSFTDQLSSLSTDWTTWLREEYGYSKASVSTPILFLALPYPYPLLSLSMHCSSVCLWPRITFTKELPLRYSGSLSPGPRPPTHTCTYDTPHPLTHRTVFMTAPLLQYLFLVVPHDSNIGIYNVYSDQTDL